MQKYTLFLNLQIISRIIAFSCIPVKFTNFFKKAMNFWLKVDGLLKKDGHLLFALS